MNIESLKDYYNRIDKCSISLNREADFEYIQSQITKIAIYTDDLNRIIGELLIEKTRLEHIITDLRFEYELKFTDYSANNAAVRSIVTGKERKDYINYFLLKDDYRNLLDHDQSLKDLDSLIDFAKKKARDLDKLFPKLQTLWESLQREMKYIKKIGSDSAYIEKVRKEIETEQKSVVPIFTDSIVEDMLESERASEEISRKEPIAEKQIVKEDSTDLELDALLADL